MCGIAGYLGGSPAGNADHATLLRRMADAIAHRGPDDAGYWCDMECRIGLGHRRLAIVDLSPAGHQPMRSASGRYVIVYNGEIYNHMHLREQLQRVGCEPAWRGHSDTETLLAGFDAWGMDETLMRTTGMFALAVWDRQARTLTLARDRIGEKPLYYGWQGDGDNAAFLFGSELKALGAHPSFGNRISRSGLSLQMQYKYIPAPHSIYDGIAKLPPGCLLEVSLAQREPRIRQYWSASQAVRSGVADPFRGSPQEALDELERMLSDAVGQQMMADVPLGAFLSGGIDSSLIVALMQAQSIRPVKTFSIGFHDQAYNEADHAKAVARHLGTEHTELYVTAAEAMAVVPRLPMLYDEPFSDSSQIPTFLVSELARRHVTVSLSGDAGDELFCGYGRYQATARLWRRMERVPLFARTWAAKGLRGISPQSWDKLGRTLHDWLPRSVQTAVSGDRMHKGARTLESDSLEALYRWKLMHWHDPATIVIGGGALSADVVDGPAGLPGLDDIQRMMAVDLMTYLPDDILVKVDRAAMSVSLETRVPFLDHRVVEFAWRMPQTLKLRDGKTKWLLRQLLYRHVPAALIERPKMGFAVPIGAWLRGPLRDWAESLLDESRLRREGYFHAAAVREKWKACLAGRPTEYFLWDVLMFQSWLEHRRGTAFSRAMPARAEVA
jgi:asparagine synthase (glutamine-hydrolysing)